MKKIIFKPVLLVIAVIICAVLISVFTGKNKPETATVDNTGANTVTAYNTESSDYELSIDANEKIHDISDLLFGLFFEDINFAADGGLYAEMVVNRSFEFTELAADDALYRWNKVGEAELKVEREHSLNENNPSYLVIENSADTPAGTQNIGFLEGMSINEGENYKMSFYAKSDEYQGAYTINLAVKGKVVASAEVTPSTAEWTKYTATLTPNVSANENVTLQVLMNKGKACFDMISLFPENTYKGRENGLRNDLATKLQEIQPAFLRFPGGCVIEGYDINSAYDWKESIGVDADGKPFEFNGTYGDIAARKMGTNIWTDIGATDDEYPCFMTYGLGFYEYFLLSEDIGAVGVPVLNCGLYCQARGRQPVTIFAEDGTYTPEFTKYLDDMLDLVEFCRGDESTTWGKVRTAMGHKEHFELKYICIGNENWSEVYFERYSEFLKVFNKAKAENPELYAGLELIYSAGPDDADSGSGLYMPSYDYAKSELDKMNSTDASDFAGATDHHYYNTPSWFLQHSDYYDEENYSRSVQNMTNNNGGELKVFLGEYAAQSNTLKAALAEAAYMTGLERNGDIVVMAAYAPLFGNNTARHWAPDLIWFNNHSVTPSVNYYVQQLFAKNAGTQLLDSTLTGAENKNDNLKGAVGVGTWYTSAKFDNVKIMDNVTGEILTSDSFDSKSSKKNWEFPVGGEWEFKEGALVYPTTDMSYSQVGTVAYFGDKEWTDYTFTVEATKLDGSEGFLVPFAVQGVDDNIFWNIGGWENTVSTLQQVECGSKTGQLPGTTKDFVTETGRTYELKIEVKGDTVKCYIDGELYIDYDFGLDKEYECYSVVSTDDNGDIIIKLVNVTDSSKTVAVDIANSDISGTALINQVAGNSLTDENVLDAEETCTLKEFTLEDFENSFNYTMPAYSVTSIRLGTK